METSGRYRSTLRTVGAVARIAAPRASTRPLSQRV